MTITVRPTRTMPWFIASYLPPLSPTAIREPWLTPGHTLHDGVARSAVDHDVLDASRVALGSHMSTVRFSPSRSCREIVITETVGADVTDVPSPLLWPLDRSSVSNLDAVASDVRS